MTIGIFPALAVALLAALGGVALGLVIAVRRSKWRDRAWLRNRAHACGCKIQKYFGNPQILHAMAERSKRGHRFQSDRQYRDALVFLAREAFGVGEAGE